MASLPGPLEGRSPLVVVSPHCDDAVFACGFLLDGHPGSTVVTVFAGGPPTGHPLTEWDRAAGFRPGDDVMAMRRAEDRAALSLLDARPRWLPFWDSQYGRTPRIEVVAMALSDAVGDLPGDVVLPLGLFHSDHLLVHEAGIRLMKTLKPRGWFLYADALYRTIPGLLAGRLAECQARGPRLDPVPLLEGNGSAKGMAVGCYRSQLRALATPGRLDHRDAWAAEQYWRVLA